MKGLPLLFIASLLFVTSSCVNTETKEELIFDQNTKQIIFFTDGKDYEQEVSYYDAIIELKKDFPNEIKNMKIITASNAQKYYNTFEIQNCPAILLIYQEKILVKIKGEATKSQIVQPFSHALGNGL
ncbi:small peptidoglycan-associated lipoprotein [Bacillus sp. FJAT-29790]|uniref:small peptidoglycan-associated lipoprotein n=1 Tax=Bacillus sp. FJAT-29790 TaxID=1895002 RepID=UPI001C21410B|nr:small peptidoglycan-associated lipoprotein [Bacillus sp. FJAT-29790]MBU8877656.1 small peptidoglycan-associated lipoprotein [Bacillus sp. FJAT-29790]